ncbi:hypothetical protein MKEN_01252300 [Mycena kentingensis (nom. inval.)]|nr:hypothetical protein MKEN_01252300 [Mycena kentingensis (nom. inval.)]
MTNPFDPPPPAYSEIVFVTATPQPQQRPEAAPARSDTHPFPRALTVRFKRSWTKRDLQLYSTDDDNSTPLHHVSIHTKRPHLVLHSSADNASAPLATASYKDVWKSKPSSIVTLFPLPDASVEEELEADIGLHTVFRFALDVGRGKETQREYFEWRTSRGEEVRALNDSRFRSGMKLVRLTGNPGGAAASSSSDGKEIVAVWADQTSFSLTKVGKFEFIGSGATGEMGERFAVMAVVSCLRIWDTMFQISQGIGSSNKSKQ